MASITIKIHLNSQLEITSNSNYVEKGPENINIKSKIITVNSNKTVPPYLFMNSFLCFRLYSQNLPHMIG